MAKTINVLGTKYRIVVKKYDEDEAFGRRSIAGYCDTYQKTIVLCDMRTYKEWQYEPDETCTICQKNTLRHEIVHAFLAESGLDDSAWHYDGAWSRNEELVDWIAIQGAKVYKAWIDAKAI